MSELSEAIRYWEREMKAMNTQQSWRQRLAEFHNSSQSNSDMTNIVSSSSLCKQSPGETDNVYFCGPTLEMLFSNN